MSWVNGKNKAIEENHNKSQSSNVKLEEKNWRRFRNKKKNKTNLIYLDKRYVT